MKAKFYKVRLTDGTEQRVHAIKYELDKNNQHYLFIDEEGGKDQYLPLSDVKWIVKEVFPSTAELENFTLISEEIHREHLYIGNRMSWYITSQSFIMTAFAVSLSPERPDRWMTHWFLPWLGILITTFVITSIVTAFRAINHYRNREPCRDNLFEDVPKTYHLAGKAAPLLLPFFILSAWVLALLLQK